MMKRRNVVMGVILASVLIAAVVIPATFGVGTGGSVRIYPKEVTLTQNSPITFTITLYSPESTFFDIEILSGGCDGSWFEWSEQKQVRVERRVPKQLSLNVRPTESRECYFKVTADSRSGGHFEDTAWIISEPPITPTPTPTPTTSPTPTPTNQPPTCIGLEPNLPSPQKIMNENATIAIKWTAYACDPDGDAIWYMFWQIGPGGEEWTDWNKSNEWTWFAGGVDIGDNTFYVAVKDDHHTNSTSSCNRPYKIIAGDPPFCACLMPDKFSPQGWGEYVKWTACVADNESAQDIFWYRFLVNGVEGRGWGKDNTWTWGPTPSGTYNITVMIRDNFYGSPLLKYPDTCDIERTFRKYTIASK